MFVSAVLLLAFTLGGIARGFNAKRSPGTVYPQGDNTGPGSFAGSVVCSGNYPLAGPDGSTLGYGLGNDGDTLLSFPGRFQDFGTASVILNPVRHVKEDPSFTDTATVGRNMKSSAYTFPAPFPGLYGSANDLVRDPWVSVGTLDWVSGTDGITSNINNQGEVSVSASGSGASAYESSTTTTSDNLQQSDGQWVKLWAKGNNPYWPAWAQWASVGISFTFDFGAIEDDTPGTYTVNLAADLNINGGFGILPGAGGSDQFDSTWFDVAGGGQPPYAYAQILSGTDPVKPVIWRPSGYSYNPTVDGGQATGAPAGSYGGAWYRLPIGFSWTGGAHDYIGSDGKLTIGFFAGVTYHQHQLDMFDWEGIGGFIEYKAHFICDYITCSVSYSGANIPGGASPVLEFTRNDYAWTPQASPADYLASDVWGIRAKTSLTQYASLTITSPRLGAALYMAEVRDADELLIFDFGLPPGPYTGKLPFWICGSQLTSPANGGTTNIVFSFSGKKLSELGALYYTAGSGPSKTKVLLDTGLNRPVNPDSPWDPVLNPLRDPDLPASVFDYVTYKLSMTYNFLKMYFWGAPYHDGTFTSYDFTPPFTFTAEDTHFIGLQFNKFIIDDGPYLANFRVNLKGIDYEVLIAEGDRVSIPPPDEDGFTHWNTKIPLSLPTQAVGAAFTVTFLGDFDTAPPEVPASDALNPTSDGSPVPGDDGWRGTITSELDVAWFPYIEYSYFDFFDETPEADGSQEHPALIEELSRLEFAITYSDDGPVDACLYWQQPREDGGIVPTGSLELDYGEYPMSEATGDEISYYYNSEKTLTTLTVANGFALDTTWMFWAQFVDAAGNWVTTRAYYIYVQAEGIDPVVTVNDPAENAVYGFKTEEGDFFNPTVRRIPMLRITASDTNLPQDGTGVRMHIMGSDQWFRLDIVNPGEGTFTVAQYILASVWDEDTNGWSDTSDWAVWAEFWGRTDDLMLADGYYELEFEATDTRGNPGYAYRHLYLDTTKPDVTPLYPADSGTPYVVNAPFDVIIKASDALTGIYYEAYMFSGSISGGTLVDIADILPMKIEDLTIKVGSHPCDLDKDGNPDPLNFFDSFPEGEYRCSVGVLDAALNIGNITFIIRIDRSKPVLSLTSPGSGAYLSTTPPTFQFNVVENFGIASLRIAFTGGLSREVPIIPGATDYAFTLDANGWGSLTPEGPVTATITAADGANWDGDTPLFNTGTASITFIRDILPPRLALVSPLSGGSASDVAPSYQLTLEETYLVTLYYTLDDGKTTRPISGYSGVIDQSLWDSAWAEYTTIKFVAIDRAGNVATVTTTIKREDWYARSNDVDLGMFMGMPWQVIAGMIAIATVTFVVVDRSNRKAKQKVPERPVGRTTAMTARRTDSK